jgi:hypothetical protein
MGVKLRLRVYENRVLRRVFGSRRDEMTEDEENCITMNFMSYTLHQV